MPNMFAVTLATALALVAGKPLPDVARVVDTWTAPSTSKAIEVVTFADGHKAVKAMGMRLPSQLSDALLAAIKPALPPSVVESIPAGSTVTHEATGVFTLTGMPAHVDVGKVFKGFLCEETSAPTAPLKNYVCKDWLLEFAGYSDVNVHRLGEDSFVIKDVSMRTCDNDVQSVFVGYTCGFATLRGSGPTAKGNCNCVNMDDAPNVTYSATSVYTIKGSADMTAVGEVFQRFRCEDATRASAKRTKTIKCVDAELDMKGVSAPSVVQTGRHVFTVKGVSMDKCSNEIERVFEGFDCGLTLRAGSSLGDCQCIDWRKMGEPAKLTTAAISVGQGAIPEFRAVGMPEEICNNIRNEKAGSYVCAWAAEDGADKNVCTCAKLPAAMAALVHQQHDETCSRTSKTTEDVCANVLPDLWKQEGESLRCVFTPGEGAKGSCFCEGSALCLSASAAALATSGSRSVAKVEFDTTQEVCSTRVMTKYEPRGYSCSWTALTGPNDTGKCRCVQQNNAIPNVSQSSDGGRTDLRGVTQPNCVAAEDNIKKYHSGAQCTWTATNGEKGDCNCGW